MGRLLCEPKGSRFIANFRELFTDVDYNETFNFTEVHQAAVGLLPMTVDEVLNHSSFDSNVDARDKEGKTPLYWAARKGDTTAVEQLIRAGADVNARDIGKDTPLGAASRSCSATCMQILIDAGALVENKDCFGYTALANVGKWQDQVVFAETLIQAGASPDALDIHGATAFARSARYNHCDIGAYLLDHGADIDKPDSEGNPPIFEAATADAAEYLVLLLAKGARQDVKNGAGCSLIHILATHASAKTFQRLADSKLGMIDMEARDRKGRTALELINDRVLVSAELRAAFYACVQPSLRRASVRSRIADRRRRYQRAWFIVPMLCIFLVLIRCFARR